MKAIFQNDSDRILVIDSFAHREFLKSQSGAKWNPYEKGWSIPITLELIEELQRLSCTIDQKILDIYNDKTKCLNQAVNLKLEKKVVPIQPMPIKVKAYEHQIRGYNIACEILDLFD